MFICVCEALQLAANGSAFESIFIECHLAPGRRHLCNGGGAFN